MLALLFALLSSNGPDEIGPLVQPTTYSSPSGEWQLFVDPIQRSGAGAARYRMTRNGAEVWASLQPFTYFDCDVDDRGYVGGHSNLAGNTGGKVEYVFPILAPDGEL